MVLRLSVTTQCSWKQTLQSGEIFGVEGSNSVP